MRKKILIPLFMMFMSLGISAAAEDVTVTDCASFSAAMHKFSGENNTVSVQEDGDFSSQRLIVLSDETPETYGAENTIYDNNRMYVMFYDSPSTAETAYEFLTENGISAIPDLTVSIAEDTPSLSLASSHLSWGADFCSFSSLNNYIQGLYGYTSKIPEVKVAVIDSGVDYNHPFLSGRVNYSLGYDFVNGDNDPMDDNSHGTHVAGIIADCTLSNVTIVPYKAMAANGNGSLGNIIYAMENAQAQGMDVINLSLGTSLASASMNTQKYESFFNDIINNDNIVIAAASGNISSTFKQGNAFPVCMDGVIGVASCDKNGTRASTSNYYNKIVDITAPGVNIRSTILSNDYGLKSGTSMACPHVSAAAAALKSINKNYSSGDIENMLELTASYGGTRDERYGYGIMNLDTLYNTYFSSSTPAPTASPTATPTATPSPTPTPVPDVISNISLQNNYVTLDYYLPTSSAYVIVAGYGSDGVLNKTTFLPVQGSGHTSLYFNSSQCTDVKVFMWSDFENPTPLSKVYKVK